VQKLGKNLYPGRFQQEADMAIPKVIVQTFKTQKLPFLTRWQIARAKRRNPQYEYLYFDDAAVDAFIRDSFDDEILRLYRRINIGAAKGDFFRYAFLLKHGGVYIDIDSCLVKKLDDFLLPNDQALIAWEGNGIHFVQWVLVFAPGHPFMQRTMEIIIDNLRENRFPYDVHQMTGPTAYTHAVQQCLAEDPSIPHRVIDIEHGNFFRFRYAFAKPSLYGLSRRDHWCTNSASRPVLIPTNRALAA
jgi:mannosyltransferase OCH1-like enzyme